MFINEKDSRFEQQSYIDLINQKMDYDMQASKMRKEEINFMKFYEQDFTDTPARKLYYNTTPIIDSILTEISNLRYIVNRLNEDEYQNAIDNLQSNITKLSLLIKQPVIEESK